MPAAKPATTTPTQMIHDCDGAGPEREGRYYAARALWTNALEFYGVEPNT
jgi:hypothetical protein